MADSSSSTVAIPGAKPGDHGADDRSIEHKLAVGHQELDRIVDEVEQVFASVAQAGVEWLSVSSAGQMVQSAVNSALAASSGLLSNILPGTPERAAAE